MFWPVYKNLEKEVIQLANYVQFTDDQINAYSLHIADLIVRCAIEIEALSKELYKAVGGDMSPTDTDGKTRDLFFDTDCIDLLEKKWKLSKKQIIVSATNFYFTDNAYRILTPLHKAYKRGSSGSKWKQAYQAVKHDRINSLKKASIENLLQALGALYILNLYFKDETIDIGRVYMSERDFDTSVGSDIFSVLSYKATVLQMSSQMDDRNIKQQNGSDLDKSIYIIKYNDKSFQEMHKDFCLDSQATIRNFNNSPEIRTYLSQHPEDKTKNMNEICIAAGGVNLLARIVSFEHSHQNMDLRTEAVLNKHSNIYPALSPISTN